MKKILYIFLISVAQLSAQRIQNFQLILTNTIVSVRFSVSAGSQCAGYNVLHSVDSLNYYPIYNYGGICGDLNTKQDYKYDHYSPVLDAVNFYKIELTALETSPPQRIYVPSSPKTSMLLYPNPIYFIGEQLNFRIFNAPNQIYYGYILHHNGHNRKEIIVETYNETAAINVHDLPNGVYVLWLTDGEKLYSSKFYVDR
jgi:hypothetical protein